MIHPPARPTDGDYGNTPEVIFMQRLWDILYDPKVSIFIDSPTAKFNKTPQGYQLIIRVPPSKPGIAGMFYRKEYDPLATYSEQNVVKFTPDGGSAGMYIALQSVPAGVSPDTGAPYWDAFPNSPPGVWA